MQTSFSTVEDALREAFRSQIPALVLSRDSRYWVLTGWERDFILFDGPGKGGMIVHDTVFTKQYPL